MFVVYILYSMYTLLYIYVHVVAYICTCCCVHMYMLLCTCVHVVVYICTLLKCRNATSSKKSVSTERKNFASHTPTVPSISQR